MKSLRIEISGLVQGVGFRPFVYRQALKHKVNGRVFNTSQGVEIEAQAEEFSLGNFVRSLRVEKPVSARIHSVDVYEVESTRHRDFKILESSVVANASVTVPHDLATCDSCLAELFNPADRRYLYPFITCNDCGPRFSIADTLPFDRCSTSMSAFPLCKNCTQEYNTPSDRRFHAQTMSCPDCGPQIYLKSNDIDLIGLQALKACASLLSAGKLLAIKGVGGYQFVCSAAAALAIARIRNFKERSLKPLALMVPKIADAEALCSVSQAEREMLLSATAPVVIIYRKGLCTESEIHSSVAPHLESLGIMLPANPIYHLIFQYFKFPLVVTSANHKGDPMYTNDMEIFAALSPHVDAILSHNREILHMVDDSVVRYAKNKRIILRHARGLAPTSLSLEATHNTNAMALGGHSKSAFAIATQSQLILSQYLGDLDSRRSRTHFEKEISSYARLYKIKEPFHLAIQDAHSAYASSEIATKFSTSPIKVWHHEAHLNALLSETQLSDTALAFVCDGTGLGEDGNIWGGEFYLVKAGSTTRVGSLWPFPLVGGERAVKEPRRSALGMIYASDPANIEENIFAKRAFTAGELELLLQALDKKLNAPLCSSLGRLFDGFSALLGLGLSSDYEAQGPIAMEERARGARGENPLPIGWVQDDKGLWLWDWRNLLEFIPSFEASLDEQRLFCSSFHATIVAASIELAKKFSVNTLMLSGGVFQNASLVEIFAEMLERKNMSLYTHKALPPNDGSLAMGQLFAALRKSHVCA